MQQVKDSAMQRLVHSRSRSNVTYRIGLTKIPIAPDDGMPPNAEVPPSRATIRGGRSSDG